MGGLIGLGGAEFRLPVLVGPLRYTAKQAVPLNLAVSLITVAASLVIRGRSIPIDSLWSFRDAIAAIILGAVSAAAWGTSLAHRLSEQKLRSLVRALLFGIGLLLVTEGFLPESLPSLVGSHQIARVVAGVSFGLAIGVVSSLLGVAGGELIIPTMVFVFGADIKTAGSASLIISLPTVLVAIVRYWFAGHYRERSVWLETIGPMGIGSVIGAIAGGLAVGIVPPSILKVALGVILVYSSLHMRAGSKKH